jgi:hypothetical protein
MRRRKLSRQAPPRTLYPELGDWRGFRARRRTPRLALLSFLACLAVAGTAVMAIGGHGPRGIGQAWLLSLAALQLVVVAECRLVFRGPLRHVLPVATALVVPALVAWAVGTTPLATIALAALFVALAFVPQRWLDRWLG